MNKFLLDALRCPFCSGKFTVIKGDELSGGYEYAVLSCYCERYPVVAGIPIIRKGVLGVRGETTEIISRLIESDKNLDAFLSVAMPPDPHSEQLAPQWLYKMPQFRGVGRVRSLLGKPKLSQWREQARNFLTAGPKGKTASEYFDFYFRQSGMNKELYNYFTKRFGQPRHLVALSLMTLIEPPSKPILDFGCGFGHLTRHLSLRAGGESVVGADREFARLYVAKTFLAPDALYVCCDGQTSLPFADKFFSVTYSSDTLYVIPNKVICSREIQRVTDSKGLILVAGIENGLVQPRKYPGAIPYHTYGLLFDQLPHRILANSELLNRYMNKYGPVLAQSSETQILDNEQWFSIVATKREELLVDRGQFADWPHAEAPLELNSLYKPVKRNVNGDTLFKHTFPSMWYEQEDGDCLKYEPEQVLISSQILEDLSSGKRTAEMEDLIAHCVILGVPDRFH